MRTRYASLICSCLFLLAASPAAAQDVFAGSWQVTDAQPAPWVDGSAQNQPDIEDAIRHGRFTFTKNSVDGPAPFNCKKVQYTLSEVGPDYLFEGGLTDPAKQAAALGFKSDKIVSLNMGCVSNDADIEMDFDLIDHDTAVFALNNVIYKMVRAPAP
ncbi:MAG TPA: hypothetical protein VLV76_13300 [Candidatus Acidoferrum sp.]|nr:hypothetical protein [Candidatus Acidoferrum sp.]